MKEKFEIKNLLGNSQKRTYRREVFRQRRAGFVLCLIICLLAFIAYDLSTRDSEITSPNDLESMISGNVVKVEAKEDNRYCGDPQAYLRCKAQDLGIDDYTTSKIINMIGTCENGTWDPERINQNTDRTRSLDVGIMQINLYWHPDVTLSEMIDYKKNIDYGLNMFLKQGFDPWTCGHKLGYV